MKGISYKDGYKYQLQETYKVFTSILPNKSIETEYITLDIRGLISIKEGYAWDGPSGPTIDTQNFMRGSLIHDALYQLMREGHLSADNREMADKELVRICIKDGMSKLRAWWVYKGVRLFAGQHAFPANQKPILNAP